MDFSGLPAMQPASPLESFLRDFVEHVGGAWDEVEPQVYDLLLPSDAGEAEPGGQELIRVAFDPDALPEHRNCQLAGFGTPLIDRFLAAAARRGQCCRAYRTGLNLQPHGLATRVLRCLTFPAGTRLELGRVRALSFPAAVYWFQATFVSDQKEYQLLPVGFDLHYSRQVRHLDRLLAHENLGERPDVFLPDAKHASPAEVFSAARKEVIRTLSPLANARLRELNDRVERQAVRMEQYYADMLEELAEQQSRAQQRGTDLERYAARRQAIEREQRLRVAELRQKSALGVHLRLAALLVVRQPKLRIEASTVAERGPSQVLELVYDPLLESLEAVPCPECHRPTYAFDNDRLRRLGCPACAGRTTSTR